MSWCRINGRIIEIFPPIKLAAVSFILTYYAKTTVNDVIFSLLLKYFSPLQRTFSKANTLRSGGASKASWKQPTVLPRPVCHWCCRFYIGCPVFPGISPTVWEFPQCLPMVPSCMNLRLGE